MNKKEALKAGIIKLNDVIELSTTIKTEIKYDCSNRPETNIARICATACVGNRSRRDVAHQMGRSVPWVDSWLHRIQRDPYSVPREIYTEFFNMKHRRFNITVDMLDAWMAAMQPGEDKDKRHIMPEEYFKNLAKERRAKARKNKLSATFDGTKAAAKVDKSSKVIDITKR